MYSAAVAACFYGRESDISVALAAYSSVTVASIDISCLRHEEVATPGWRS